MDIRQGESTKGPAKARQLFGNGWTQIALGEEEKNRHARGQSGEGEGRSSTVVERAWRWDVLWLYYYY